MTLLEMCVNKTQTLNRTEVQGMEQILTQNPEQAEMLDAVQSPEQTDAQALEHAEMHGAVLGLEQSAMQEDVRKPVQDAVQNMEQTAQDEVPEGLKQEMKQEPEQDAEQFALEEPEQDKVHNADPVADVAEPAWQLPPKKVKPSLTTISLRVTQEEKATLQKLAEARDMSMGEFFASIARSIIAHATGRDSRVA